jgi:flagellar motor switch protein FliG
VPDKNGKKGNFFLNQYKRNSDDNTSQEDTSLSGIEDMQEAPKQGVIKKPVFEKLEIKTQPQPPRQPLTKKVSKRKLSAIFLVISGIEKSAAIVKSFSSDELSIVCREILQVGDVTRKQLHNVESAFGPMHIDSLDGVHGGKEFVRKMLQAAFGVTDGSQHFIKVLEQAEIEERDFSFIEVLPPKKMKELLAEESDMVIALICSLMDSAKVAAYLTTVGPARAAALVQRMSGELEIQPEVLKAIKDKMREKVEQMHDPDAVVIPGKNRLAEILKNIDPEQGAAILDELATDNPELAGDIEEQIFTFTDIAAIPRKELEKALKGYADGEIAFLLKGADESMKTIFLTCLTRRRREIVKDEIQYLGAVKRSDVLEKRRNFIAYLKQLEADGKIILRPDSDQYVD